MKQAATNANVNVGGDAQAIDALFKKVEVKMPEIVSKKPQEPDYAAIFKASLIVSGYANDGLIIDGRFYATGEKLDRMTMYGTSGKAVVPKIESVRNGKATFAVGGKKVVVDMEKN